jgi:KamA family protein
MTHAAKRGLKPRYITRLNQIPQLSAEEVARLQPVTDVFAFRVNDYYLSLIDWKDPADPIRRLVIPDVRELTDQGALDASDESAYTICRGLEHKYDSTALLLVNQTCGGYCRFCFRKRLFMNENKEVTKEMKAALEYIRQHPEINNVLLTGGDPVALATSKLEPIVKQIREIDHVQVIRIGTKMPAFNPYRIIHDPSLLEMIERYTTPDKKIYMVVHFNHPRELTEVAVQGLDLLQKAGAVVIHQTPLIKGVNDDPEVLCELFNRLSFIGVAPYYVFQCRPTRGNRIYSVPVEQAYAIFDEARIKGSGLAKRARFVMSHTSGKIEVAGMTADNVFFRYLRAADNRDSGKFMVYRRIPEAYWFDDYLKAPNALLVEFPVPEPEMDLWAED